MLELGWRSQRARSDSLLVLLYAFIVLSDKERVFYYDISVTLWLENMENTNPCVPNQPEPFSVWLIGSRICYPMAYYAGNLLRFMVDDFYALLLVAAGAYFVVWRRLGRPS